jgi:hypothetical protein
MGAAVAALGRRQEEASADAQFSLAAMSKTRRRLHLHHRRSVWDPKIPPPIPSRPTTFEEEDITATFPRPPPQTVWCGRSSLRYHAQKPARRLGCRPAAYASDRHRRAPPRLREGGQAPPLSLPHLVAPSRIPATATTHGLRSARLRRQQR